MSEKKERTQNTRNIIIRSEKETGLGIYICATYVQSSIPLSTQYEFPSMRKMLGFMILCTETTKMKKKNGCKNKKNEPRAPL